MNQPIPATSTQAEDTGHYFYCLASIIRHFRDKRNYPATEFETEEVQAGTLEELYEKMADLKVKKSWTYSNGQYQEVEFETILEVCSDREFNQSTLVNTETWKKHLEDQRQKQEIEKQNKAQAELAAQQRQEELERQQLAALKAKYES